MTDGNVNEGTGVRTAQAQPGSGAASGSDAACASCKYFVPSRENEFTGICRRNPPSVKDRFGVDYWPTVGRGAWCGEYKHQNDQAQRRPDNAAPSATKCNEYE